MTQGGGGGSGAQDEQRQRGEMILACQWVVILARRALSCALCVPTLRSRSSKPEYTAATLPLRAQVRQGHRGDDRGCAQKHHALWGEAEPLLRAALEMIRTTNGLLHPHKLDNYGTLLQA